MKIKTATLNCGKLFRTQKIDAVIRFYDIIKIVSRWSVQANKSMLTFDNDPINSNDLNM